MRSKKGILEISLALAMVIVLNMDVVRAEDHKHSIQQPSRQQPSHPQQKSHQQQTHASSALKNFKVVGKVAFSRGKEGGNASLFWEQKGNQYAIRLVGAMGSGTMEIYGRPGFVGLRQSNGESHTAKNAEQLIKKVLGWDIPVSPLRYWLQGQPVPGAAPNAMTVDKMGRLVSLRQYGWHIHYQDYTADHRGRPLPTRITLENGPIRLKFIFREWA